MDKKRILVIDDEESVLKSIKVILEKSGEFEIIIADKGLKGINLAKNYKPDLILLDIIMPEMDGLDIADVLLKDSATKNIPIAFLTNIARKEEVGKGMIGKRYYIPKSIRASELIERVKRHPVFKKCIS